MREFVYLVLVVFQAMAELLELFVEHFNQDDFDSLLSMMVNMSNTSGLHGGVGVVGSESGLSSEWKKAKNQAEKSKVEKFVVIRLAASCHFDLAQSRGSCGHSSILRT